MNLKGSFILAVLSLSPARTDDGGRFDRLLNNGLVGALQNLSDVSLDYAKLPPMSRPEVEDLKAAMNSVTKKLDSYVIPVPGAV